jgi:hypothetical protein
MSAQFDRDVGTARAAIAQERAAIVAWLRGLRLTSGEEGVVRYFADAIERGDHIVRERLPA